MATNHESCLLPSLWSLVQQSSSVSLAGQFDYFLQHYCWTLTWRLSQYWHLCWVLPIVPTSPDFHQSPHPEIMWVFRQQLTSVIEILMSLPLVSIMNNPTLQRLQYLFDVYIINFPYFSYLLTIHVLPSVEWAWPACWCGEVQRPTDMLLWGQTGTPGRPTTPPPQNSPTVVTTL